MNELQKTIFKMFDESANVQDFVSKTDLNDEGSVNETANQIIQHASGTLNDAVKENDQKEVVAILETVRDHVMVQELGQEYLKSKK